jgi:hypothetical protein
MQVKPFGLAALLAATGAAVAIGAAPIAVADECNPINTVCQGPDVESSSSPMSFAPAPVPDSGVGAAPSEMGLTSAGDTFGGAPTEMGLTDESGR